MSRGPLRFLHAGSLHLERTLSGVAEVPDHLREIFVDAPYQAARRLFDAAIDQRADFLVIVGDLLHDWGAGPRAAVFLAEQFARLEERRIGVYWAGGVDRWPEAVPLPSGVQRFRRSAVEEMLVQRDGVRKARILGTAGGVYDMSRTADLSSDQVFTLALLPTEAPASSLDANCVEYWALGHRSQRETFAGTQHVVHDAGYLQGCSPREEGPHGCTLVEVDSLGHIELQSLGVDVARWHHEVVTVDQHTTRVDLESLLRQHVNALRETGSHMVRLVAWTITGAGPLMTQLRHGSLAGELLESLRRAHGFEQPMVWSTTLKGENTLVIPPQLYEEDSLLGDFLRVTREHVSAESELWHFDDQLGERHVAAGLGNLLAIGDDDTRQRVLRQATTLGIDLLSGEELEL